MRVVQANMEAMIAKARADERAHFEAEWNHRMACHQLDGTYGNQMDESDSKEKRKAEEQLEPDEETAKTMDLTKIPTTPTEPKPVIALRDKSDSEAGPTPAAKAKAKATARVEPY